MPDLMDNFLLPLLYTILAAAIPIIAGVVVAALRQWAERQKAEWLRSVLAEAASAAEMAALAVDQTFTRHVRDAEGKLDPSKAHEALMMALEQAKVQLGTEGMSSVIKAVGGPAQANSALTTMVEAAVRRTKVPTKSSDVFLAGE